LTLHVTLTAFHCDYHAYYVSFVSVAT